MSAELSSLNKQAITAAKGQLGEFAWPTVLLVVASVGGVIALGWGFAQGLVPLWLALPGYGVLTYFSYTPLHEAVHRNIHGRHESLAWLNALCGYAVAPIIAVPYSSHKVEHFAHHRYTNQQGKDPDIILQRLGDGPLTAVAVVLHFVWVQNTYLLREHWERITLRERLVYAGEVTVSIGWRLLFAWWAVAQLGVVSGLSILAFLLGGYLLGGLFTLYWFAYRPHHPYRTEARYQNTSSLIVPGWMKPLRWFWLGQDVHSVHHLFPRVPFYRYHRLHREIEPAMRAHGTPIIGMFSRRSVKAA